MTRATDEYDLHWVDDVGALAELAPEWRMLAQDTGADIYAMPDWVLTWWKHFGGGRQPRCLVARHRHDKALAGVLPFMIDTVWLGPVRVRIARLAATDPHTIIFRLPARPGALGPLLGRAFHDLLGARRWADLVSFSPASEQSQLPEAVHAAGVCEPGHLVENQVIGSHTVFHLPDSFDTYLSGLSKKRRGQFRRDLKRLQSDHGLETALHHPDRRAFLDFVAFHNRQWQETGHGGHFADWRGSAEFYAELSDTLRDRGSVWIDQQTGNDGAIAAQFSLVAGQTCHWRLPARSLDPALNQLSIGKVGLILMIRRLIESGITRIEAGAGEYGYKLVYGGQAVPLHRLIVCADTPVQRARLRGLLVYARALHLVYYRLWFGRLSVRLHKALPLAHRPLWRSWIRTRV